jgi:hypothetical protein
VVAKADFFVELAEQLQGHGDFGVAIVRYATCCRSRENLGGPSRRDIPPESGLGIILWRRMFSASNR